MRLALALLTTFCLLLQQTVVAASMCAMDGSTAPAMANVMPDHCAGMATPMESPTLCKSHCAPDLAVVPDYKWPPVHFVAMLPPALDLLFVPVLPDPGTPAIPPVHRSDPPARLRFCSLLI
ncbi:MAG: hypothetical protein IPP82_13875 [Xanthomonadales bacterium]|nr:hypothetical protein [Xanthomonadales bacterium]